MKRVVSLRGLWLVPAGVVGVLLLTVLIRIVRPFGPPAGRPIANTGSDPVSLEAAWPTAAELRSSLADANVLIVVTDAARADHAGCYGYPRETTPNMDRIATDSLVFEQHFSQFPHTRASTSSLFTGQYPDTHGVYALGGELPGGATLAESLRAAGFETGFFSGWIVASPSMGFGEDFDFASAPTRERKKGAPREGARRDPQGVLDELSRWLDERDSRRLFAYVHFLQPHGPYDPPEEMARLFIGSKPPYLWHGRLPYREIKHTIKRDVSITEGANLYDGNCRYADWAVGELERLLRERNLLEKTLLIITSDHGEAFGEHGYEGHLEGVYDEHVHIPLVVRFPGKAPPVGRVRALTETVDILPTVLDLFALAAPETAQGVSLVPLITGESPAAHDFIFARAKGRPESYLVRDLRWAMIFFQGGKLRALYDLEDDPWQTRNLIDDRPEVAERMAAALRLFAQTQRYPPLDFVDPNWRPTRQQVAPDFPKPEMSDDTRRELEALGYVD